MQDSIWDSVGPWGFPWLCPPDSVFNFLFYDLWPKGPLRVVKAVNVR